MSWRSGWNKTYLKKKMETGVLWRASRNTVISDIILDSLYNSILRSLGVTAHGSIRYVEVCAESIRKASAEYEVSQIQGFPSAVLARVL